MLKVNNFFFYILLILRQCVSCDASRIRFSVMMFFFSHDSVGSSSIRVFLPPTTVSLYINVVFYASLNFDIAILFSVLSDFLLLVIYIHFGVNCFTVIFILTVWYSLTPLILIELCLFFSRINRQNVWFQIFIFILKSLNKQITESAKSITL